MNHGWLKRDDIILDGISFTVDWTMVLKLDNWFSAESPSRFSQKDFTFSSSDSFINGRFALPHKCMVRDICLRRRG